MSSIYLVKPQYRPDPPLVERGIQRTAEGEDVPETRAYPFRSPQTPKSRSPERPGHIQKPGVRLPLSRTHPRLTSRMSSSTSLLVWEVRDMKILNKQSADLEANRSPLSQYWGRQDLQEAKSYKPSDVSYPRDTTHTREVKSSIRRLIKFPKK